MATAPSSSSAVSPSHRSKASSLAWYRLMRPTLYACWTVDLLSRMTGLYLLGGLVQRCGTEVTAAGGETSDMHDTNIATFTAAGVVSSVSVLLLFAAILVEWYDREYFVTLEQEYKQNLQTALGGGFVRQDRASRVRLLLLDGVFHMRSSIVSLCTAGSMGLNVGMALLVASDAVQDCTPWQRDWYPVLLSVPAFVYACCWVAVGCIHLNRRFISHMVLYRAAGSISKSPQEGACGGTCRRNIYVGDSCVVLPCGHAFHKLCAKELFMDGRVCRVCKVPVLEIPRSMSHGEENLVIV